MRLLLISNSTPSGGGYLDHCAEPIVDFLGDTRRVVFVPWAAPDHTAYGETACHRLERMGLTASWIGLEDDAAAVLSAAEAVFVGGGNTFCLLDRLHTTGLLAQVRDMVREGVPYIGTSAGSNIAGPTIKTTNDMPIVEPPAFTALDLVPFQINPHYVDRDPDSSHQGETRDERLREYLQVNRAPVLALREGAMVRVEGSSHTLLGTAGALVFRRDREAAALAGGTRWEGPGLP